LRAHELWDGLERDSGRRLFTRCGGIMVGTADARTITGSPASAAAFGIPHELLDAREIRRRFPTMAPSPGEVELTADESFVVAPRPAEERVVLACGFSGHGSKFAPVIGEVLADLVVDGGTAHPIEQFDAARLLA
jgi:glycine/D-amino acid oxidase-like deaminating enzyme